MNKKIDAKRLNDLLKIRAISKLKYSKIQVTGLIFHCANMVNHYQSVSHWLSGKTQYVH